MTVEELKDLMLCLIEEGRDKDIVVVQIFGKVMEIKVDNILLVTPASNFLTTQDLNRFGYK